MTSYLLAPLVAIARRIRAIQRPAPRPLDLSYEVTPGMRGKPLLIYDADGNLIGTIGNQPRHSDDAMRMIG